MISMTGSFHDFFAGVDVARAGLGSQRRCLLASDFDYTEPARDIRV